MIFLTTFLTFKFLILPHGALHLRNIRMEPEIQNAVDVFFDGNKFLQTSDSYFDLDQFLECDAFLDIVPFLDFYPFLDFDPILDFETISGF